MSHFPIQVEALKPGTPGKSLIQSIEMVTLQYGNDVKTVAPPPNLRPKDSLKNMLDLSYMCKS